MIMKTENNFKYIYGPVESWRMGKSLGVDPISDQKKMCNLDCPYCQLGRTNEFIGDRKVYVSTQIILDEINQLADGDIDYITFSGRGEPTLAKNLGEMICTIQKIRKEKIAVITNSTLLYDKDVRHDLLTCDLVMAKLDAFDQNSFMQIDVAMEGVKFEKVIEGIKQFRQEYKGKLALQIMFVRNNYLLAGKIAQLAKEFDADEIQLNTPLRPSGETPLNASEMEEIKQSFSGLPFVMIYEREIKKTTPYNDQETIKRHGNFKKFDHSR